MLVYQSLFPLFIWSAEPEPEACNITSLKTHKIPFAFLLTACTICSMNLFMAL